MIATSLIKSYLIIKDALIKCGFEDEINWQINVNFASLDQETFLKECAWVILNSGMKETVIRKKFPNISEAFYNYDSRLILENPNKCVNRALKYFGH